LQQEFATQCSTKQFLDRSLAEADKLRLLAQTQQATTV